MTLGRLLIKAHPYSDGSQFDVGDSVVIALVVAGGDGPEVLLEADAVWAMMPLATSLGSQFWFGILVRFVNIRSAGDKPEDAKAKAG